MGVLLVAGSESAYLGESLGFSLMINLLARARQLTFVGRLAPPVIPATGTQPVDQGWGNGQVGYGASMAYPWVKSPEESGNTGDYPTSKTVKQWNQFLVIVTKFWSRWQFQWQFRWETSNRIESWSKSIDKSWVEFQMKLVIGVLRNEIWCLFLATLGLSWYDSATMLLSKPHLCKCFLYCPISCLISLIISYIMSQ